MDHVESWWIVTMSQRHCPTSLQALAALGLRPSPASFWTHRSRLARHRVGIGPYGCGSKMDLLHHFARKRTSRNSLALHFLWGIWIPSISTKGIPGSDSNVKLLKWASSPMFFWGYPSKIKTCPMTCVRQDAWIAVLGTAARSCGFQSVFTAKLQRRMMKWRWQPNMGYRRQMAGYLSNQSNQSSIQGETHRSHFTFFQVFLPVFQFFAPFLVCQESSGMESETSQTKPCSNPLDLWIRGLAAIFTQACWKGLWSSDHWILFIGINQWVLFPITSYIRWVEEILHHLGWLKPYK